MSRVYESRADVGTLLVEEEVGNDRPVGFDAGCFDGIEE